MNKLCSPLYRLPSLLLCLLLVLGSLVSAEPREGAKKPLLPPVRFLMHNVEDYFVAGEQRSRYNIRLKPEASREAVAEVIASGRPDIVGLIEIGGEKALEDLRQRLAARGLSYPHSRVLPRRGEDRALGILSRYPIAQDNSRADYPLYGQQRRNMLRGILDVTVKHPDGRSFRLMGVHLKSHVANDAAAADSLRKREADTLALHVAEVLRQNPNERLLVFGDWNDNPDAPALAAIRNLKGKSALHRVEAQDTRGESWTLFYRGGTPTSVFDQIYVNTLLRGRMGRQETGGIINTPNARRASAHRAVWCEMR